MTDDRPLAITGAAGFVGSRLVAEVTGAGRTVRALVRAPRPWLAAADQHVVDLLGAEERLAEALHGVSAVIHLAGHNEVIAAQDPDRALAETVIAARRVTDAAVTAGVDRVVFVSTVHVYGVGLRPGARVDEDLPPAPRGAYAVARLAAEHLVAAGPDPVVLRLTNAVGAPVHPAVDRWTLVAAELCRSAIETGELELRSSGQQWRDFIGLQDVARALAWSAAPSALPAGTYNLSLGRSTTVRALAELIQERVAARTGRRPVLSAPAPVGPDPEAYVIDPSRLRAAGFRATQPLEDAVDEIIDLCAATTAGAHP